MSPKTRNLIELNVAVLLWGGTALFAKLIDLPLGHIIFGRSLTAALALGLFVTGLRMDLRIRGARDTAGLILIGVLLGVHWLTYFHAIQVSTVAVAIIALHTYPMVTILLEPWFFGERLHRLDFALGIAVLVGVAILVPELDPGSATTQGVLWGVVSAVFFALRNLLTRRYVQRYPSSVLMFYQALVILVCLAPYALFHPVTTTRGSVAKLVLLGVVFTALPQTLFTSSHTHLKAKTVSIIATLLPVYGPVSAALFLGEIPSVRTVIGGVVVVVAVAAETFRHVKAE
ncbi:MAG: EamA family transporter [Verrucomicrobiales bacterium]|nr:EamA family transporter [Verrucomicrobiales bacterium]